MVVYRLNPKFTHDVVRDINVKVCNWILKFRKVVRQHIAAEWRIYRQFICSCSSERIVKIGLCLPKLS